MPTPNRRRPKWLSGRNARMIQNDKSGQQHSQVPQWRDVKTVPLSPRRRAQTETFARNWGGLQGPVDNRAYYKLVVDNHRIQTRMSWLGSFT